MRALCIALAVFLAGSAEAQVAQPSHALSGQSVPAIITFPANTPNPQPPPDGFFVSPTGADTNPGTVEAPFATPGRCQQAIRGPGARSTARACYLRAGNYAMTASLQLGTQDAGETWAGYPYDATWSAILTQLTAFAFFVVSPGADNVTITGLAATGAITYRHGSCGGAEFVDTRGGVANLTVKGNSLYQMDCGFYGANTANLTLSNNRIGHTSYGAFGCTDCDNTTLQNTLTYDLNLDDTQQNRNTYGITFARGHNNDIQDNTVVNSATWECYDTHTFSGVKWIGNLCVGYGAQTTAAFNNATISPEVSDNGTVIGNVLDSGPKTSFGSSIWTMCGNTSCKADTGISGTNVMQQNTQLTAPQYSFSSATSPMVNVSSNTASLPPETVTGVTLTATPFAANRPGAVVATVGVQMSAAYWAFPTGIPCTLGIGGTNSGHFQICDKANSHAPLAATMQICQADLGTPPGTYSDFSLTVTLRGMMNPTTTIAAGQLTLTGQ